MRKCFKDKCKKLGLEELEELDLHSCRIGGATESSRMGARRDVVKQDGG